MKKILLFTIAMQVFATMFGQITITESDLPAFGFSILLYKDTVVTPPAFDYFVTDTNYTWNPGNLTHHTTSGYILSDPSTSLGFSSFPTSNLMLNIPTYGTFFLKSTANELITLGMIDSTTLATPTTIIMNRPDTMMIFPLKYDTTYTSHSGFDTTFFYGQAYGAFVADSVHIKNISVASSHVDGWGTIVHPDGDFDVIRESKIIHSIDSLWARLQSFGVWVAAYASDATTIQINFHASGYGLPIFSIKANTDSIVKEIEWVSDVPTAINFNDDSPLFSIFPNPSNDFITIETLRGETERIDIYDLNGRLICSVASRKSIKIDVSSWEGGMYSIQWINNNKVIANSKFIKL